MRRPAGRGFRLRVAGEGAWDALVAADGIRVVAASRSPAPDAPLSADPRFAKLGSSDRSVRVVEIIPMPPVALAEEARLPPRRAGFGEHGEVRAAHDAVPGLERPDAEGEKR